MILTLISTENLLCILAAVNIGRQQESGVYSIDYGPTRVTVVSKYFAIWYNNNTIRGPCPKPSGVPKTLP